MHTAVWSLVGLVGLVLAVAGGGLATAAQQTTEYDITETKMGCEEAHRITRRALERLHYKVADGPPATDTGSTISAQRMGFWGEPEPVSVAISCTTDGVQLAPRAQIPPCEQANRIMRKAVEKTGYAVTTYQPAALGGRGRIRGEKPEQEPLELIITCEVERNRVIIDTSSESPLMAADAGFYDAFSDFQRGFYAMFRAVVDEFAYRQSAYHQTQVANMDQVQVGIVPMIPADITRQFGDSLTALLPVRITLFNSTTNAYVLDTDNIVLLADSGRRVKPAAPSEHTLPQPPLANQTLPPGGYVEGYLFYPSGVYTGARGFLTEQQRQEREGFSVQF